MRANSPSTSSVAASAVSLMKKIKDRGLNQDNYHAATKSKEAYQVQILLIQESNQSNLEPLNVSSVDVGTTGFASSVS